MEEKMRKILVILLVAIACSSATTAVADKLPKSAKPLTADEIKSIYSNHTAVWKPTNKAYFAQDGKVWGIYDGGTFEGSWNVTGNEGCMMNKSTDAKTKKSDGKTYTDCWTWYRDNKNKYWSLWSKHFDGSPVTKNDYWDGEIKKLKIGDLTQIKN
jgi:hypothetical protein